MNLTKEMIAKLRVAAKLGTDDDIQKTLAEILDSQRKTKNWQEDVERWTNITEGFFSLSDCYKELGAITKEEKNAVRVAFHRLCKAGVLERKRGKDGWYRRIENDSQPMDWQNAPTTDLPIKFPLGIEEFVSIYPGNVIVVAGRSNAGKTAFLLEFIKMNQDKYKIHYFTSEMGETELRIRLSLFQGISWNFQAWERTDNYADAIYPDDINLIDFLDITDEFWKAGHVIKEVHSKLRQGIAIIALQKSPGRDTGRGGEMTLEKPRLYIALDGGQCKIVKAKNWKGSSNPNGKVCFFKLLNGHEFIPISVWHHLEDDPFYKPPKNKWREHENK